jgi:hypothetical protein
MIKYDCFEVHKLFTYLQEGRRITWVCIPTFDRKNFILIKPYRRTGKCSCGKCGLLFLAKLLMRDQASEIQKADMDTSL